jgi:uncharacterized lipoprotein YmbA
VFVVRVDMPEYLSNPGLATRWDETRIEFSAIDQWAEPIRDGATRVLRDELSHRLGAGALPPAGIRRPSGGYLEVQVALTRFECDAAHRAHLWARWRITKEPEHQIIAADQTRHQRTFEPGIASAGAEVAALSGCIEDLAAELTPHLLPDQPDRDQSP